MGLFDPSKKIGPNPKPYSERFLSDFYENSKKKLFFADFYTFTQLYLSYISAVWRAIELKFET